MADTQMIEIRDTAFEGSNAIEGFAARVLDVLVSRSRRACVPQRADLVRALADGLVTRDEALIDRTLAEFRRACISPSAMIDVYVPEAARLLGAEWVCDGMSFAEVTMATARLQSMVRAICTRWGGEFPPLSGRGSVLMVVPPGEDHTLGAIVATGQMRRMGVSVCLRLRPATGEIAELLRSRDFSAAMISVARTDRLRSCRPIVDTFRRYGAPSMPVVIGGAAIQAGMDVAELTGVCHVASDAAAALAFCGLAADVGHARAGTAVPALLPG